MRLIGENNDLIDKLLVNCAVLDSELLKYDINFNFTDDESLITISLDFKPIRKDFKNSIINLQFLGVLEFSFDYHMKYGRYDIGRYKFFKTDGGIYYFSIDPYDESKNILSLDNDFIKSSKVVGSLRNR